MPNIDEDCTHVFKEEFNLKKAREEFKSYLKEQFGEDSMIPADIWVFVTEQDKEFIKRLKEDLKDRCYNSKTVFEEIDKLAGEKLTK